MRFREIAGLLRLSKDEKKDLYRVLDDLVAEGKADLDSKGRYSKVTGRKRGKEKQRGKEKNVTRSFRVNVPGNMQKKAPRDVPGRKMRNIPIRNIMISRLESMITASPTIVTAGEKNKYNEYSDSPSVEGTFIGHPKGFGFVEIEGEDNDVFIPEDCTGTAMHQDKVRVIITKEPQEANAVREL